MKNELSPEVLEEYRKRIDRIGRKEFAFMSGIDREQINMWLTRKRHFGVKRMESVEKFLKVAEKMEG